MKKNILIIFKEKKKDRVFDFYLERKFSQEFNVNILYLNQYFYLTTKNIIKKINEKIKLSKINIGDRIEVINN